ncbi:hypothetical protein [Bradyrhizobium yuanmingense]|uniref:hypothetical protein n=1 Tax=Bradyrhizobium yuanmingense TaxID=108015 RepID=UPI0023B88BD3|nr:hypothetical protein [Bradyrhizobium yuanmingense]MDF0497197.1 hypothetical protein [Bradyrhizobium yuanmingense]
MPTYLLGLMISRGDAMPLRFGIGIDANKFAGLGLAAALWRRSAVSTASSLRSASANSTMPAELQVNASPQFDFLSKIGPLRLLRFLPSSATLGRTAHP